jgi:hypothetical protein
VLSPAVGRNQPLSSIYRVTALFAVLFTSGTGCRSREPKAKVEAEPEGFELISPGSEPRAPLRYQLLAGSKHRTTLRIVATPVAPPSPAENGASRPMPTVALTTETEILPASATGEFPMRIRVVEAKLEGAPNAAADQALERWRGAELRASASATGALTGLELRAAGETSATTDPQLQSLSMTMQQLALELPRPALGVGASWAVERPFPQGGLTLKARTIYKLVDRDATTAHLRSQILLSAPDQTVEQGGVTAQLAGFTGSGEGDLVVDLQRLTATGTTKSSYRGSVTSQGTTAELGMQLSVELTKN